MVNELQNMDAKNGFWSLKTGGLLMLVKIIVFSFKV